MGYSIRAKTFYGIAFSHKDQLAPYKEQGSLEEYIYNFEDFKKNEENFMGNIEINCHGYEYSDPLLAIKGTIDTTSVGQVTELTQEFFSIKPEWQKEIEDFISKIGLTEYVTSNNIKIGWNLVVLFG